MNKKSLVLLVTCAVIFLDSLDTSTVGVALPTIQHALHMSPASLQWLVSGYTVAYGGFLLLGGRAADLLGRRRVFLVALTVFVLASALGGAVTSEQLVIASRVIKGISAALTAPAAFAIIIGTFREGPERNRALAVYGATAAVGYSVGLIASGLLTSVSWRLVFIVPGALALAVLIVGPGVIDADPRRTGRGSYDPFGSLLGTTSILLLVYGLVAGPVAGWRSAGTVAALAGSALLMAAFVLLESRHPDPTLPLSILRSRVRSSSYLVALFLGAAAIGWQFVAVLYLQGVLGYGPLKVAFALLPIGVTIFVVARFLTGRLIDGLGIRIVSICGLSAQVMGLALFGLVSRDGNYLTVFLPGLLLHGIALGTVFAAVNIGGVSGHIEERHQGVAAGLIVAAYAIGTGIGAAVVATVLTVTAAGTGAAALLTAYRHAFVVAALIAALGLVVAIARMPGQPRSRRRTGAEPGATEGEPTVTAG